MKLGHGWPTNGGLKESDVVLDRHAVVEFHLRLMNLYLDYAGVQTVNSCLTFSWSLGVGKL